MVLEASGYTVIGQAKNGQDAVDMYRSFHDKPDIIIMDHRMPVKDGIEATKEILQINPKAKIIFASADNSVIEYTKSIGVISFESKPFSSETLIKNIEKALKNISSQNL